MKEVNKKAIIIVVSHHLEDAIKFYEAGATYVITPHFLGGLHTSNLIEKSKLDKREFETIGKHNLVELKKRQKQGHRLPEHSRG